MKYQFENFGGEYDFRSRAHNDWRVDRHIHEYSELLYCKSGVCRVYVNGAELSLSAGQLIWLPPNYIHQYHCVGAEVVCAVFSNDFIPLFFHIAGGRRLIPSAIDVSELSGLLDEFPKLEHDDPLIIASRLNLICSSVIKRAEFERASNHDGVLFQKVISYISEHFREDISLRSLAGTFNYHEKYLSHTLHQLTNMHFTELVAMYRIEYAKKLLGSDSSLTIAEIALSSGFSAINTFNRSFRRITGSSPSQYRRGGSGEYPRLST